MSAKSFSVYTTGKINPERPLEVVIAEFGDLFKVSSDRAEKFVTAPKIVKSGLSAEEADRYVQKISAIGVVVEVVNKAANELVEKPSTVTSNVSEVETPLFFCPKCHAVQEKSEECTNCGIIFSRYRAVPEAPADEPSRQTRTAQLNDDGLLSEILGIVSSKKSIALVAGLAMVLGSIFFLVPEASKPQTTQTKFLPAVTHSPSVAELLALSGMTEKSFESFDTELQELFERELPLRANSSGAKQEDVLNVLELSKLAFNGEAALISLGNSFSQWLTEEQISEFAGLYRQPLIRRAFEDTKNRTSDNQAYKDFASSLERSPIGPRRLRALEKLVTVTQYDKLLVAIWSAGQVTLDELAAITVNKSMSAKKRRNTVSDVKDMAGMIEPAIRQEAIKQFAWMYKDYSLFQLGDLATSYDKPGIASFSKEVRAGIKSYFSQAVQLVRNEHLK